MWAIIPLLAALTIAALGRRPYQQDASTQLQNIHAAATASDWALIDNAATAYIKAFTADVEASSTATTPAVITVPMLEATQELPASFAATNPFGQQWVVDVVQPTAGQLEAFVLSTGGTPIPEKLAPLIANMLGQEGGIVPYNNQNGTLNSSTAVGSYGDWSVSLAASGITNPGPGHLVALLAFNNGNLDNDFLNRNQVPGEPQLNTMNTALNMGAQNITNANNIQATSEQLPAGNPNGEPGALEIGNSFLFSDGTNAAVRTPGGVFIQNQAGTAAAPINEVSTITATNIITPGAVATQGTACPQPGAIGQSTNGTGQLLSCVSGTWQVPGGGTGIVDVNTTGTMACSAGTTGILDLSEPFSGVFDGLVNLASTSLLTSGNPPGIFATYATNGTPGGDAVVPMLLLSCGGGVWTLQGEPPAQPGLGGSEG